MLFVLAGLFLLACTPADSAPLASYLCTAAPGLALAFLGAASMKG